MLHITPERCVMMMPMPRNPQVTHFADSRVLKHIAVAKVTEQTSDREVLPDTVVPTHYDLFLEPNVPAATFAGEMQIKVDVKKATTQIVMNAVDLVVQRAQVIGVFDHRHAPLLPVAADDVTYDKELGRVTLHFSKVLQPGKAEVFLRFSGIMNEKMDGFYRSEYTMSNGEKRWMASTQFEAAYARQAFPCWDEPNRKATFRVTIVTDEKVAISNTTLLKKTPEPGGKHRFEFAQTPKMSTYLVAYVVGDMEYVEKRAVNGVLVRGWTTPGKKEQAAFVVETSCRVLVECEKYFEKKYPLSELHLVAIPNFRFGAMENWGCVTFRETLMLLDPKNSSMSTKQAIASVDAHELAHQWFGNLVTPNWWDDLALNEGFATWLADKLVKKLFPEWGIDSDFVVDDVLRGLHIDGLENSHSIAVPVRRVKDVDEVFDALSYSKAGSCIRMIEAFMGEEVFRKALVQYMQKFEYGNAVADDLWKIMETVSGRSIRAIMHGWWKQVGHPLVTATVFERGGKRVLSLQQRRFFYSSRAKDAKSLWQIPLVIRTPRGQTSILLTKQQQEFTIVSTSGEVGDDWVCVNGGANSFCRVAYRGTAFDAMIAAVKEARLDESERILFQDDVFALTYSSDYTLSMFLSAAQAHDRDLSSSVWQGLVTNLGAAKMMLSESSVALDRYTKIVREKVLTDMPGIVGWEPKKDEPAAEAILRATVLFAAGSFGNAAVLSEALKRFEKRIQDPVNEIDPNLRNVVYGLAAQQGNAGHFQSFFALYHNTTLQEERVRLLRAMARFRDPKLLAELLVFALSKDVAVQELPWVIVAVSQNPHGRTLAWRFMKGEWDRLVSMMGIGLLGRALSGVIESQLTDTDARDIALFLKSKKIEGLDRTIAQSLERLQLNIQWISKNVSAFERDLFALEQKIIVRM